MLKSLLFVLAVGTVGCSSCKDEPAAAPGSSTESAESGESGSAANGNRRAKIDLRRGGKVDPKGAPSIPGANPDRARPELPADIQARREERRAEWMSKVDSDGDGQVSKAEREAARQKRIDEMNRQMDTDGDGQVSQAERDAARQQRAEELRDRLDTDGDGKVTGDELAGSQFGRMDLRQVDKDGNGDISTEELQGAIKERGERRGGLLNRGRFGRFGGGSDMPPGGSKPLLGGSGSGR
jgi:hypothetical protein